MRFYFRQIPLHLAPAVPERVIRIGVERSLERAHPVFEIHNEKLLLDHARGIVERQQIRERIGVALGLRQDSVARFQRRAACPLGKSCSERGCPQPQRHGACDGFQIRAETSKRAANINCCREDK